MEDIRKLLKESEAQIAPEALGYLARGLSAALAELLQEGVPEEKSEAMRYREMVHALTYFNELTSIMLARWLGEHVDHCSAIGD